MRLTLAPGIFEDSVTIPIVDGPDFRDNVTVFGVLISTEEGVIVGPDARVLIIEDERKCV